MTSPLSTRPARSFLHRLSPVWVALGLALVGALLLVPAVAFPDQAGAHAELIEASPDRSETVGGIVDEVALQFVGLAHPGEHEVLVLDPLGNTMEILEFDQDFNLLTVDIDPLSVEGDYIVSYQTEGIDNDLNTGSYTFTYEVGAAPPDGIDHEQEVPGVDWVTVGLVITTIVAFLAWLLYVVKRLRAPVPEADPAAPDPTNPDPSSVDGDEISEDHKGLTGTDVGWDSVVTKRKIGRDDK